LPAPAVAAGSRSRRGAGGANLALLRRRRGAGGPRIAVAHRRCGAGWARRRGRRWRRGSRWRRGRGRRRAAGSRLATARAWRRGGRRFGCHGRDDAPHGTHPNRVATRTTHRKSRAACGSAGTHCGVALAKSARPGELPLGCAANTPRRIARGAAPHSRTMLSCSATARASTSSTTRRCVSRRFIDRGKNCAQWSVRAALSW